MQSAPSLPPALLTSGSFLGSLAAARDMGRNGVPVTLAEATPNTVTASSCYVGRMLHAPPHVQTEAWLAWMMDFGRREPGHVFFATSDDICMLLEMNAARLANHFQLYEPAPRAFCELLNKRRLYEHCRILGIDQPEQWLPGEENSKPIRYPVLVKPRSQAGLRASPKGVICADQQALQACLRHAARTFAYAPHALAYDPEVATPMLQAFHPESERGVYSLAGFYAPERGAMLLRASQKVLQYPLRVGVGLCFESRPVREKLGRDITRLFDRVGYRGPFEVEFIQLASEGDRFLLIDVNPRLYGQVGFEIVRGLPVARLNHAAACGDGGQFDALARTSELPQAREPHKFRDVWLLRLYATTHLMSGNLKVSEWKSWMHWSEQSDAADFVDACDDPRPALRWRRNVALDALTHPRSTFKRFFVR